MPGCYTLIMKEKNESIRFLNPAQLEILATKYRINTFYLFGSFADGSFTKKSDIDIAYLSIVKTNGTDNGGLYFDFKQYITREIDLIDLRRAPLTFVYQIIREGRVIYDLDPELRSDFEDEIIRDYLDFAPYNRMMHREIMANFDLEAGK